MVCNDCSSNVNAEARFCTVCGRSVPFAGSVPVREPLVRVRQGKLIAGVCGGIARRWNLDPVLVRLLAVLLVVCGIGTAVVAYITLWVVMPKEPLWTAYSTPSAPPPAVGAAA